MTIPYLYKNREIPVEGGLRAPFNNTGSTIPAGRLVTGQDDAVTLPAATTDPVYGACRKAHLDQTYGAYMQRGRAIVTAGTGGVTKGTRIMPEAATGKGIAWTTGNTIAGVANTTAAADADFELELVGPGVTNV